MCSYTEVNKNKIDAILRTDRLNQGLVMKSSGVRRYSLSKANGSPNLLLDEPKPKVKNRFVYNSISILEKPKNDSQNSFYQADKSFILNRNKTMVGLNLLCNSKTFFFIKRSVLIEFQSQN